MEEKPLRKILKTSIVVPEIQREYVWGQNKEVVLQFVNDLCDNLEKEYNVGFYYSYYPTCHKDEMFLIDGQQRFTTLILLTLYLSWRKNEHASFRNILLPNGCLGSQFSYRVRRSTETFMNFLFYSNIKLEGDSMAEIVKDQLWYDSSYDNDMSIQAMLSTLDIFHKDLAGKLEMLSPSLILDNVKFWCFNVNETSQGEELYITMNNRGENLTQSEQIKPILLEAMPREQREMWAKKWEDDWEDFFFVNRGENTVESIDTAMDTFIRVVVESISCKQYDKIDAKQVNDYGITLNDVLLYFNALKNIPSEYKSAWMGLYIGRGNEGDARFLQLKALLVGGLKGYQEQREYRRLYELISNQIRRSKIQQRHIDYLKFLKNYKNSDCQSIYDFVSQKTEVEHFNIINGHELDKVKVILAHADNLRVEESIWNAQREDFWAGNLRPLISWAGGVENFSIDIFVQMATHITNTFSLGAASGWTSDIVRRAMLAFKPLGNYFPLKGNDNGTDVSFGYWNGDWIKLFGDANIPMKDFLDIINKDGNEMVNHNCEELIKNVDLSQNWSEFVMEPDFLKYLEPKKHILWDNNEGWVLVKREWAQYYSVKNMHIYLFLRKKLDEFFKEPSNEWLIRQYRVYNSCTYIDNTRLSLACDIRYRQGDGTPYWECILFNRNGKASNQTCKALNTFVNENGYSVMEEDSNNFSYSRYVKKVGFDDNLLLTEVLKFFNLCKNITV